MKTILFFIFSLFLLPLQAYEEKPLARPLILVTIAPYKFFIEKITKDLVDVQVMVPAGTSAHTFEPSPKEMIRASQAALWFFTGEPFEEKAKAALLSHQPHMRFVDLRKNVSLIFGGCCAHHKASADLHIWLSIKEAKIQAQTITETLQTLYPEHKTDFNLNFNAFWDELSDLDLKIQKELIHSKNKTVLVSHPAFAYFCRDYGLHQLSVEIDGKDPSPKQLVTLLRQAKAIKPSLVFIQPQYNNKGALLISKEIKANVVILDPYEENYFECMKKIAKNFADA